MNNNSNKNQQGSILIFALIIMVVVTIIVVALVNYASVQSRAHRQAVNRTVGLDIAEAGLEKAIWRLNNEPGYAGEIGTSYGGGVYDITITDINGNTKLLSADVYVPDSTNPIAKRTLQITASVDTDGVSFNYGAQVGEGGLVMGNNAQVIGNVYSNGDILGSNGAAITGAAIAANSPALNADQANDSPTPPTSSINFRNAAASADVAQSFQISEDGQINKVELYLRKVGNPANFSAIRITTDSGGNPSNVTLASAPLNAAPITANYGWVTSSFTSNPVLTAGTTYWLVLDASGTSGANYYQWASNTDYGSGTGKTGVFSGGPWNNVNSDGYFKLYLGGLTRTINNVVVGSAGVGDAQAHTVNNSTIAGNNYCQVGAGNNKPCDNSQPDPSPVALPISDGNISDWETDAAAGGTIASQTFNGTSGSLGPVKINGNLTVINNGVLTLTGTVWVTGTITISNNGKVKLAAGYGNLSGILMAGTNGSAVNGYIDLSNNAILEGSGSAGSYLLILSEMDNAVNTAINISNNAASAILYAGKGVLTVANNAGAKELTGYKINMSNNSTITYDSGLANSQFSSGPGGSWTAQDQSWQLLQ